MRLSSAALFLLLIFMSSCNDTKPAAVDPQRDFTTPHYVRRGNKDTVIVFVHGVFGGGVGSWTNPTTHSYWPDLLASDDTFRDANIYVYSYATPYFGQSYTIDELIENMRLVLADAEVFKKHKKVIFLCHSMGGLIVRGFLKRYSDNAAQVPLIYFFSTPTAGAHITQLAQFLSRNPQLRGMLPANSGEYVTDMQRDWRAMRYHVNSNCAYEKLDTYGVHIVDEQSASALCDGPVDPIAANHIDIVKPKDTSDLPYIAFKRAYMDSQQRAAPTAPTVTGTLQTARQIEVDCGQTREDNASIPPPIELQPQQKVVDAVASLQEAANLKEQLVEAKGLQNQSAKVHYRLVGMDRAGSGECPSKGYGIVLVTFIVNQAADVQIAGFIPIQHDDLFVALSSKSGTLQFKSRANIPAIDAVGALAPVLTRNDVLLKGAIPNKFINEIPPQGLPKKTHPISQFQLPAQGVSHSTAVQKPNGAKD